VARGDIRRDQRNLRNAGNNLRAAVLGANDGLVSNFCLIMGVTGAVADGKTILLTGVAGLAAGACSMALGEWLSVTNARRLASSQIAKEAEEIERTPQAEQRELALIYPGQGRSPARRRAHRFRADEQPRCRARHAGPRGARSGSEGPGRQSTGRTAG